ncbi:collagenase-like [Culicoides brevitarsis]|uniref:collagenase-like n=1 Tax=Culicoides brevitarsis TaxID=469753 RepID=UPI00307BC4D8
MSSNIFVSLVILSVIFGAQSLPTSINPRIVHGSQARLGQFPHQVALLNRKMNSFSLCGGSIISTDFVLTAAHCVRNIIHTTISFGTINRNSPMLQMIAHKHIIHENYNPTNLNNDIALWKLPQKLIFNEFIKPISLPNDFSDTFENSNAIVSGFGRTEGSTSSSQVLRYAFVKVISNEDCVKNFGGHVVTAGTICSIGANSLEGPCNGDSGGPLMINNKNDVLIGVASFVSAQGCAAGRPAGFVRVSKYLEWIEIKMKKI